MREDNCTLWPDQLFRVDISDLCYDHDAAYRTGEIQRKFRGDFVLAAGILKRSSRAKEIWQQGLIAGSAFLVLLGVLTGGTVKWCTDHWSDNLR